MRSQIVVAGVVFTALGTASAPAQTIDQVVANRALLNAELDRCKQLGMASIDDARCKTAWAAENKRFFGAGTSYTPPPVNVFPSTPQKLVPAQHQTPDAPGSGPPYG